MTHEAWTRSQKRREAKVASKLEQAALFAGGWSQLSADAILEAELAQTELRNNRVELAEYRAERFHDMVLATH